MELFKKASEVGSSCTEDKVGKVYTMWLQLLQWTVAWSPAIDIEQRIFCSYKKLHQRMAFLVTILPMVF